MSKGFEESKEEIVYNTLPLSAIIFMDDIFRLSTNKASAQFGNNVIEEVTGKNC